MKNEAVITTEMEKLMHHLHVKYLTVEFLPLAREFREIFLVPFSKSDESDIANAIRENLLRIHKPFPANDPRNETMIADILPYIKTIFDS